MVFDMSTGTDKSPTADPSLPQAVASPDAVAHEEGGARPMQTWTMREAADMCAVSLDTIKRRRSKGRFPNARKDEMGTWRISSNDLAAVARAEGWGLTLPDAADRAGEGQSELAPPVAPGASTGADSEQQAQLLQRVHEAEAARMADELARAQEDVARAASSTDQALAERDRARSDLEHERSERQRLEVAAASAEATAEAVSSERDRLLIEVDETRALLETARTGHDEALDSLRRELDEARSQARWRFRRQHK